MDKKKGVKNILWGIAAELLVVAVGIIVPRLVLTKLGSEANGLLNSVTTVLAYLSVLEAGIGTASIQALYRPIAGGDRAAVSRIMSATDHYYRRTGRVYLAAVVAFALAYTFLIRTGIPRLHVFLVILLSGLSGVLNYFFQGKFKLLLTAEGKKYVVKNITTAVSAATSLSKALVLAAGGNIVAVQAAYFALNLVQMLIFLRYMRRNYGWVNYRDTPDLAAVSQRRAVLVHQISALIFNNTDVLVLTVLTSLKEVSVYTMYAMVFGMVKAVVTVFTDSFTYALGQSFHDRPRFLRIYDACETYSLAAAGALFCIAKVLVLPFLRLYTAGVTDANYVDAWLPWLFVSFYLLHNGRAPSGHVIDIAQKFEETKRRSMLESAINLVSSVVLTYFLGIYGAVLGTILALLYRTNDMIVYASGLLKRTPLITYRRWITNIALLAAVSLVCGALPIRADTYPRLIVCGLALSAVVIPLFLGVNSLLEPQVAKYALGVGKQLLRGALRGDPNE